MRPPKRLPAQDHRVNFSWILLIFLLAASPQIIRAQGTLEDYQRAAKLISKNAKNLALNAKLQPYWLPDSERFYYARQIPNGKQFILVDPLQKTKEPAFDHARIASALSKATGQSYAESSLPFDRFDFVKNGSAIRFDLNNDQWTCTLATEECVKTGKAASATADEVLSPDGHWSVFQRDHNLYLRAIGANPPREIQLTFDGTQDYDYGTHAGTSTSFVSDIVAGKPAPPEVSWSPDSKRFLTYRLDQRKVPELYLIQSAPPGSVRPKLFPYHYAFPGETNVATTSLIVFDVAAGKAVPLQTDAQPVVYQEPVRMHTTWWTPDSQHIYFTHMTRDFKEQSLWLGEASSGQVRLVIKESSNMPMDPAPGTDPPPMIRTMANSNDILWFSERDNWGHLYLYDGKTGTVKNQVTRGNWAVRKLEFVDEAGHWIYFTAGGREPGDPYNLYLYRVKFDGSNLQLLTRESGNHAVKFSPSGKFFIDTWSQVTAPPVTVIRTTEGTEVTTLEHADVTRLLALGWKSAEPFTVKSVDGVTDLYGVIYRPSNFSPDKQYPVIDNIYPGPQSILAPKSFEGATYNQSLAELGFVVVILDGKGGPFRSRDFHLFSYGHMGNGGDLEGHIAGLQQLAKRFPYMDLTRVGIYGDSAGGFAAARAIFLYPDFYKVAVAGSGTHDQRRYIPLWGERFEGIPQGDNYDEQINARLAPNLKGKLLLACGDMDDNVPPSNTLQLVDALIKANRDFDLLILPNRNHHGVNGDVYYQRRRWDYFVKNLLHVEPPLDFDINAGGK